jgi:hypothetical protein
VSRDPVGWLGAERLGVGVWCHLLGGVGVLDDGEAGLGQHVEAEVAADLAVQAFLGAGVGMGVHHETGPLGGYVTQYKIAECLCRDLQQRLPEVYGAPLSLIQGTLESLTAWLVLATFALAIATIILAGLQFWGVTLQRRELKIVEDQLGLNRQQIDVTREQLRAHLEIRDPVWPAPGQLPTATVEYVSGSEVASDVCTWFRTQDGRRYGKVPNTPSPSRTAHGVTIEELPDSLEQAGKECVSATDMSIVLTGDEWWAAVTWRAADKRRYGWIYVQRTDHVEHKEFALS